MTPEQRNKEFTTINSLRTLLQETNRINRHTFKLYYMSFVQMDSTTGLQILEILNSGLVKELQQTPKNATPNAALLTLKNTAQTTKEFVATKWNNLIELVSTYHSIPSLSDLRQTAIPAAIVVAATTATAIVRATGFGAPDVNSTQAEDMCYESHSNIGVFNAC
jgi:hypothetical protein